MSRFDYSDARHGGHGTMVCTACRLKIETGEYRYRQKSKSHDWYYVAQHRACSADDPQWAKRDDERAKAAARHKVFVDACIAFRDQWNVDELDCYIPEIRQ